MSLGPDTGASVTGLEWDGELAFECGGARAARLVCGREGCVLEVENLAALRSLRPSLEHLRSLMGERGLGVLAQVMPARLTVVLHGISIGHYEPSAPLNWEAEGVGLPFGHLAIDKMELLRASLRRSPPQGV